MGNDSNDSAVGPVGTAAIFAAAAFFLITISVLGLMNGLSNMRAEERAVTTTGHVTDTWVTEQTYTDTNGHTERTYNPHAEYYYTVDGTNYTSTEYVDDLDGIADYGTRSAAEAALPAQGEVTVYYLPNSPDRSFLVKPDTTWYKILFFPVLALPFALIFSYLSLYNIKQLLTE
jgi:hypothetical protein